VHPGRSRGSFLGEDRKEQLMGGTMAVKDTALFDDLVGELPKKPHKLDPLGRKQTVTDAAVDPGLLNTAARRQKFLSDRKQKMEEKNQEELEALRRNLRWRIADTHAARDQREAARLKLIQQEQDGFVREVDDFLNNKKEQEVIACKTLLNHWEKEVYHRIEGQIATRLKEETPEELNSRLCDQMEKYVEAVDEKTLFRDIIIESEYNPYESKRHIIKVDTRPRSDVVRDGIKDPLDEQIEKVMEIHIKKTAEDLPIKGKQPGKPTLPLNEWATGVIEDTPHGFAHKLFERSISDAQQTMEQRTFKARRNKSTMHMNHYSYAKGKDAVAAEYPKGKKCFPGWEPGQDA